MRPLKIKRGDRYGLLTIIRETSKIGQYRAFELKCDCGNTYVAKLNHLQRSKDPVRSCGCRKRAVLGESRRTHGMTGTPTYKVWLGMLQRCRNPNGKSYANYGGRGIRVCKRWLKFENFFADMGERPSDQHEIDRIDNDGNYQPGNVRWLDDGRAQVRNRRKIKDASSKYRGVDRWAKRAWRARITIDGKVRDLGLHDSEEDAARAYDAVARLYKGYHLNFPEEATS